MSPCCHKVQEETLSSMELVLNGLRAKRAEASSKLNDARCALECANAALSAAEDVYHRIKAESEARLRL